MRVFKSASSAQSGVGASAPSCPSVEMSVSSRSEFLVVDGDLVVAHEGRRLLQEGVVAPAALVLQLAQLLLEGWLVLQVEIAQRSRRVVDHRLEIRLGAHRPACRRLGRSDEIGRRERSDRRRRWRWRRARLLRQRLITLGGGGGRRRCGWSCRSSRRDRIPRVTGCRRRRSLPQGAAAHTGHNANCEQRPQS